MSKKRLSNIDLDTGEILEGQIVLVNPKRKMAFYSKLGHFSMAQDPLDKLSESSIINYPGTMRVFIKLLAKLDFENLITINQTRLAKELGMRQPNVSTAIKRLINEGILLVGTDKNGAHKCYRLNPLYVWKGSAKSHAKAVSEYMKTGLRVIK